MEPGNLGVPEKQSRDYLNKTPLLLKCSNKKNPTQNHPQHVPSTPEVGSF